MKIVTYTEHGRVYPKVDASGEYVLDDDGHIVECGGETIERRGVVWSPGPLPSTVWVLMAEVIEDGYTPNTSEAVVVDTRTLARRTDWTLADGLNVVHKGGEDGRAERFAFYGYGWRENKIPGTTIPYGVMPTRHRKLTEKAWRGVVGEVSEWVEACPVDPDQIELVAA